MKKIFFIILTIISIASCQYSWAKKSNIVKTRFGYSLFGIDEETNGIRNFFIPIEKLDTSRDIIKDLILQKKKNGFIINVDRQHRMRLMSVSDKIYNELYEKNHVLPINDFHRETIGTLYVLPVSISYIDIYPIDDNFKMDTTFVLKGQKLDLTICPHRRVRLLDIYPLSWERLKK